MVYGLPSFLRTALHLSPPPCAPFCCLLPVPAVIGLAYQAIYSLLSNLFSEYLPLRESTGSTLVQLPFLVLFFPSAFISCSFFSAINLILLMFRVKLWALFLFLCLFHLFAWLHPCFKQSRVKYCRYLAPKKPQFDCPLYRFTAIYFLARFL